MAVDSDHFDHPDRFDDFDGAQWTPNGNHTLDLDPPQRPSTAEADEDSWANTPYYEKLLKAAGRAAAANSAEWSE